MESQGLITKNSMPVISTSENLELSIIQKYLKATRKASLKRGGSAQ
jgi:hypothetical protein